MTAPDRIVFVGQAPSRRTEGLGPFRGLTGRSLEELAGLPEGGLRRFELRNLFDSWPGKQPRGKGDAFPVRDARAAAAALREKLSGRVVVLVGRNVSIAFGLDKAAFFEWHEAADGTLLAVIPHPSGVNHWYNDPENAAECERFLRSLL